MTQLPASATIDAAIEILVNKLISFGCRRDDITNALHYRAELNTLIQAREEIAKLEWDEEDWDNGARFANLSLYAAEEVDRRLSEYQQKNQILKDWAAHLSSISGVGESAEVAFLHSDPDATDIIARAFDEASNKTVKNIADLAHEMKIIIDPLLDHEKTLTDPELNIVKSFCLALHRALMAQTLHVAKLGTKNRAESIPEDRAAGSPQQEHETTSDADSSKD